MDQEGYGVNGIPTGNLTCGVGYIIIPKGVDIEIYKKDVYRSGKVSMNGGMGYGDFHQVNIDRECLQRIKFPDKIGSFGTPIVWINMPKHNEPIIIGCLKYDDEYHQLSEQRVRITKTLDGKTIDFDIDAGSGKIAIGVSSTDPNKEAIIDINLTSKNDNSKFRLNVNGDIIVNSTGRVVTISESKIESAVSKPDGTNVARMVMNSDQKNDKAKRFLYEDEYKNAIYISKDEIQIKADNSSKIKFGDGKEPMILGKTLKSKLDDIISAMQKLTVPTAFGPSGTPVNIAEFLAIQEQFETFLSKLTNTD